MFMSFCSNHIRGNSSSCTWKWAKAHSKKCGSNRECCRMRLFDYVRVLSFSFILNWNASTYCARDENFTVANKIKFIVLYALRSTVDNTQYVREGIREKIPIWSIHDDTSESSNIQRLEVKWNRYLNEDRMTRLFRSETPTNEREYKKTRFYQNNM